MDKLDQGEIESRAHNDCMTDDDNEIKSLTLSDFTIANAIANYVPNKEKVSKVLVRFISLSDC